MIKIPLSAGSENAHQQFSIQLGDNLLNLEVNYVTYIDTPAWSLNVYRDGSPLALGCMLVSGADVLAGYDAGIGKLFFVGSEVTLENLGIDNHLVWVTD
jgi:hypothetical protein